MGAIRGFMDLLLAESACTQQGTLGNRNRTILICGYILAIPLLHPGLLNFKLLQFQFHFKVFRNLLVIEARASASTFFASA